MNNNERFYEMINLGHSLVMKYYDDEENFKRIQGVKDLLEVRRQIAELVKLKDEAQMGDDKSKYRIIDLYAKLFSSDINDPELKDFLVGFEELMDFENFEKNPVLLNWEILIHSIDITRIVRCCNWMNKVDEDDLLNALKYFSGDIKERFSSDVDKYIFYATMIYAYRIGYRVLEEIPNPKKHDIQNVIVNNVNCIFIKGGGYSILPTFLSFEDDEKYRFSVLTNDRNFGKLESTKPYLVATNKRGNRIATASFDMTSGTGAVNTIRAERIFNIGDTTLRELANDKYNTICDKCITLTDFAIKARASISIGGDQGTGKTTLTGALIELYPKELGIAINDFKDELRAKQRYPYHDIFQVMKNQFATYDEIFAFELVTNRHIYIQAEIVKAEEITNLINARLRLNAGTLDNIHTGDPYFTVPNMRNMALMTGHYKDARTAESDIAKGLDLIYFMARNPKNPWHIVLDRIVEVRYLGEPELPQVITNGPIEEMQKNALVLQQYAYRNQVNPSVYEHRDIMRYDYVNNKRVFINDLSDEFYKKATKTLGVEAVEEWKNKLKFLTRIN